MADQSQFVRYFNAAQNQTTTLHQGMHIKPKSDTYTHEPSLCMKNSAISRRSEEHTSELQSRGHLVCRLLLEKKKRKKQANTTEIPQTSYGRTLQQRKSASR